MVFLASFLIAAAPSFQSDGRAPVPERRDLVALRASGASALLVDGKDAGLRRVLDMLGPRLGELTDELGAGGEDIAPLLPILRLLATRPFELRVGVALEAPVPAYAQLELREESAAAARATSAELMRALEAQGLELGTADARGLRALPTPGFPSWLGVRDERVLVAFGDVVSEPFELGAHHLPEGATPSLALRVDLEGALEALDTLGLTGGELAPALELLDWLGIAGARFTFALGADEERAFAVSAVEGAVPDMRASGLLTGAPISIASLRVIPADARWAAVAVNNLGASVSMLRSLAGSFGESSGAGGEDPIEALAEETGVHLERDVLAHLGSSLGAYASDSTGGGGLGSVVLFAEVTVERALAQTLTRVEGLLNQLAADEAEGRVQVRVRMLRGRRVSTLTFPGLPVPLEPSWTVTSGFLLVGLTSEAVLAAAQQAAQPERSLLDVAAFREQLPEGPEGLYGLSWLDTPALLRDGYGWVSLAGAALANAMRSREDVARDPGPILPLYAELARGAKAFVSATRVVGDDLVETARMDRSILVNAAAVAGLADSMPLLFGLSALAGLGVRESAAFSVGPRAVAGGAPGPAEAAARIRADLLAIHYACVEYAITNDGRFPESLMELIRPDEHGMRYLESELVPVDPWGNEYLYEPPVEGSEAPRVWTLGRDGAEGGSGLDADLDNHRVIEEMRDGR